MTRENIEGLTVLPSTPAYGMNEHPHAVASEDHPAPPASPAPGATTAPSDSGQMTIEQKLLEGKVIEALQTVYDPEIPVNIYELGLIYEIKIQPDRSVNVKMTLTSPGCPVAGSLPGEVEQRINAIPEVSSATIELVWEPAWTKDRMSEAAILQLGF